MSGRPIAHRLTLGAAAAAAVVALLTGCSMISDLLPGETRDVEAGEIIEGGDTDVFTLKEGDCIDDAATAVDEDGEEITDVPTVPCGDPHTWEVFKNVTMTDDEFPGEGGAADYAEEQCMSEFEGFVGLSYEESVLDFNYYTPTAGGWAMGDRTINCLIGAAEPTTGTLRDSAQ